MNKWLEKISQHINPKKGILVLIAIILFHIFFIIHILRDNRIDRQAAERSALIQKIINVIHMTRATPISNRQVAIKAVDDPDIQVTLTKEAQSQLRYKASSLWPIIYELENNHHAYFISIELNNGEWLNVKASLYSREVLTHLLFIVVELIVFASILIAFFSINRFTVPLKKIKLSAEQLGIDLDTQPFDVYGPQVVRETSKALNQMQNRIMQLVRNRTQLLASISHDLRTPIARAQLRAQFIEDSIYKTQLLNDLNEMEHMISETLSFAREDSKREVMKKIDLVSILQSICNDASDMGANISFHTDIHRVVCDGRPISLKRAFTNIINNAIRYAGNAIVKIEMNAKAIVITIEDDGPGLPEAELEKVLEPFYRGEQSRSRDTGGVGLGLAISHDIISAHHGKIKLQNKEPHGLCVIVKLFGV